ncbi:hypothetical protein BLNAU_20459 [Blattamonas nauphoetae]|uniref:Uncharacterized protein n=1 Tax=Blattamonas nauphoetae TaxID=2049346 RepID=A0ABQ9WYK9_9EUKA|nr:hypothetical protein BLNAU_20459 [Blattamonas nauphoetae]
MIRTCCCCYIEDVFHETLDKDPSAIKVTDITFFNSGERGEITTPSDGFFEANIRRIQARITLNRIHPELYGTVPNDYQIVVCDLDPIELEVFYVFTELTEDWIVGTYELRLYLHDRYAAHKNFFVLDKYAFHQHLYAQRANHTIANPNNDSRPNSPDSEDSFSHNINSNEMPLEND